jgi:dephospho-CoA kinase
MNPEHMFSIGLTGGIGSGKTLVADRFASHGAAIIDSDLIAHAVTAPGGTAMPAIEAAFGREFVAADGSLDRARMRALVFSDLDAKHRLESITHPLIRAASDAAARAATGPYRIFVIPLLVESITPPRDETAAASLKDRLKHRFDRVLVVDCTRDTQIERVMKRNGFSREQVEAIVARQASRADRLALADDVVENDKASTDAVYEQVDALHQRYLALAGAR